MHITQIQKTNFTAYGIKDMKTLKKYTLEKKQGSLCDLYKKFDYNLVDSFAMTKRIDIPQNTQNWKLGKSAELPLGQVFNSRKDIKGSRFSKVGH